MEIIIQDAVDMIGITATHIVPNFETDSAANLQPVPDASLDGDDAPIMQLVGKPLHEMSEEELREHLTRLQEYIAQPARRNQELKDAQTKITTGRRPSRSNINVKSLL